MTRARPLAKVDTRRVQRTYTVAPHTEARIAALAAKAGISCGVLIDRAVDCLDVCEACQGRGEVEDRGIPKRCYACGGNIVVPAQWQR